MLYFLLHSIPEVSSSDIGFSVSVNLLGTVMSVLMTVISSRFRYTREEVIRETRNERLWIKWLCLGVVLIMNWFDMMADSFCIMYSLVSLFMLCFDDWFIRMMWRSKKNVNR